MDGAEDQKKNESYLSPVDVEKIALFSLSSGVVAVRVIVDIRLVASPSPAAEPACQPGTTALTGIGHCRRRLKQTLITLQKFF